MQTTRARRSPISVNLKIAVLQQLTIGFELLLLIEKKDKKAYCDVVYFNFSKAFGTIDHNRDYTRLEVWRSNL